MVRLGCVKSKLELRLLVKLWRVDNSRVDKDRNATAFRLATFFLRLLAFVELSFVQLWSMPWAPKQGPVVAEPCTLEQGPNEYIL